MRGQEVRHERLQIGPRESVCRSLLRAARCRLASQREALQLRDEPPRLATTRPRRRGRLHPKARPTGPRGAWRPPTCRCMWPSARTVKAEASPPSP
eukprot:3897705-Pyramimonas_sp.AAC.1